MKAGIEFRKGESYTRQQYSYSYGPKVNFESKSVCELWAIEFIYTVLCLIAT